MGTLVESPSPVLPPLLLDMVTNDPNGLHMRVLLQPDEYSTPTTTTTKFDNLLVVDLLVPATQPYPGHAEALKSQQITTIVATPWNSTGG